MPIDESPLHDIADRIIRKVLQHPENLRALVGDVLKDLAAEFDFARATLLPRDFLLDDWPGREADLLFEIPYRMGDEERMALICVLIEHQTRPDPRMPLRMLLYAVLYWEREWRRWELTAVPRPEFRLTPIVPIVLHTSPRPWGSARTMADLFGGPASFRVFAPRWEPSFWEVSSHDSKELLNSRDAFFQFLSVVRAEDDPVEEFEPVFREAMQRLGRLHDTDRVLWTEMLSALLSWACNRRPLDEKTHWLTVAESAQTDEKRQREVRNMGMTIAQGYYEEGELKGVQKTILRLGQKKFGEPDESTQRAIREIKNPELLQELTDRILAASSWTDLLTSSRQ